MDAYFQVIAEANAETVEELYMRKKKGVILTEKLDAIFYERLAPVIDQREAWGEARGKAAMVLTALRKKFKRIPKWIEKSVLAMSDPIALESLLEHVFDSNTMDEFATALQ